MTKADILIVVLDDGHRRHWVHAGFVCVCVRVDVSAVFVQWCRGVRIAMWGIALVQACYVERQCCSGIDMSVARKAFQFMVQS